MFVTIELMGWARSPTSWTRRSSCWFNLEATANSVVLTLDPADPGAPALVCGVQFDILTERCDEGVRTQRASYAEPGPSWQRAGATTSTMRTTCTTPDHAATTGRVPMRVPPHSGPYGYGPPGAGRGRQQHDVPRLC
ncbi:MAG: hypothetical protein ACRDZO_08270 [Egibacteraceae bacterium]